MMCDDYKDLLMGYLDGELSDEQKGTFKEHLNTCDSCRQELADFRRLIAITDDVELAEPEDKLWDAYWGGLYNRLERGVGWILFSVAAIALLIYAGFKLIECLVTDPAVGVMFKIGLIAMIVGFAILFVSVARERLFFWRRDRYKDVRR